jgi:SAM-dependent methyltransferase
VYATLINWVFSRRGVFLSVRRAYAEAELAIVLSAAAFVASFLCFLALYRDADVNVLAAKVGGIFVGFGLNCFARQLRRSPYTNLYQSCCGGIPAPSKTRPHHDDAMTITSKQGYAGNRILEAMRSGVRYGEAIFTDLRSAIPGDASSILDFGSGAGFFLEKFHAIGVAVDAVEPDSDLRSLAQKFAGTVWSDIRHVPNASFDFAYTVNVLEHILELDEACAHLTRVLKPNGKLFVLVPAHEILWTSLDDEVQHVCRFNARSLRFVLERAGFRIEVMKYFDSLGFPAALGVRVLEQFNLFKYGSRSVSFYDRYLFPVSRQLDRLLKCRFGKNLIAVASRDG